MVIDVFRSHSRAALAAMALAAAVIALPAAAAAQTPASQPAGTDHNGASTDPSGTSAQAGTDGQETPTATADAQTPGTQVPRPGTVTTVPSAEKRSPWWEFNGGYEGDTHETGYGFVGPAYTRPLGDSKLAFKAHVYATHLRYEFDNGLGGTTEVNSPGVVPAIGLRYGGKTWVQVTAGPDIDREHREIRDESGIVLDERKTRVGVSLGTQAWWNPTRRSNVFAQLSYGTGSDYTWGRLAAKHQITNMDWHGPITLYLGAEGIGQGNQDIRSWQGGGLLEFVFTHAQLSLVGRGGYKRSTFDRGPDKTGSYFGVGLWKRF